MGNDALKPILKLVKNETTTRGFGFKTVNNLIYDTCSKVLLGKSYSLIATNALKL